MSRPPAPAEPGLRIFRSRRHPGSASFALAYGAALGRALAFGMIALMIVGTASVLSLVDPLPWLTWAAPVVALFASLWALHQLRRTLVEIGVGADRAIARTTWDVLRRHVPGGQRVTPPRRSGDEVNVGLGREILTLDPNEWPEFERLLEALHVAAEHNAFLQSQRYES